MNRMRKWNKRTALLFAAALSLSAVQSLTAQAAERELRSVNVNIGNDLGIKNPEKPQDGPWEGDRILFGQQRANAIPFRVLDKKTTDFGGTTMFLDCDIILEDKKFNELRATPSNVWKDSSLRRYLNNEEIGLLSTFQPEEQAAVHLSKDPSSHAQWPETWNGLSYGRLSDAGDKLFLLDAREAQHPAYGYSQTSDPVKDREKTYDEDHIHRFWLRSPRTGSTEKVGVVDEQGLVYEHGSNNPGAGISPAFNLKLESVLFAQLLNNPHQDFSETVTPTGEHNAWTLTLRTDNGGFTARRTNPAEIISAAAGGTIHLSLSGRGTMQYANQVSAMLLDQNQTVLFYGKIANPDDHEAEVIIPHGLRDGASYTLRVFLEEARPEHTSYAGNIQEIPFIVGRADTPPANTHTVRFDLNGHGGIAPSDLTAASGAAIAAPAAPTDASYDFGGWYRDAACRNAWNFANDRVTQDMTLYAKWTLKGSLPSGCYRIRFDANGGTVEPAEMTTGTDGKLSHLPVPTRSGYLFEGWFTAAQGGTEIKRQHTFGANKTVYAHWSKVSGGHSGGHSSGRSGGSSGGQRAANSNPIGSRNSGSWIQDAKGFWFRYSNGSYPKNEWKMLPYSGGTAWYAFDEAGYLRTGWFSDGGRWYYLSEAKGAELGKMMTGWKRLSNGKWYYLEPVGTPSHPQGAMYAGEMTPDGYRVDASGAWIH